ncbi:MAG: phosphoribosylanthranilate isomerase, partial [Acidobacteriota bacterium]
MFIKICANTNADDALLAAEMGADAVGFVFAPSKRRVTTEQVAAITAQLPEGIEKIGVFHALDGVEILETVQAAGLTGAQLHGAFDETLVNALTVATEGKLRLIQTVKYVLDAEDRAAEDGRFVAELHAALMEPEIYAALLDAAKGGTSGGL